MGLNFLIIIITSLHLKFEHYTLERSSVTRHMWTEGEWRRLDVLFGQFACSIIQFRTQMMQPVVKLSFHKSKLGVFMVCIIINLILIHVLLLLFFYKPIPLIHRKSQVRSSLTIFRFFLQIYRNLVANIFIFDILLFYASVHFWNSKHY